MSTVMFKTEESYKRERFNTTKLIFWELTWEGEMRKDKYIAKYEDRENNLQKKTILIFS